MFRRRAPVDPGLELIDAHERATVQARMDHLRVAAGYTADDIEREHSAIKALAATIADARRADYRARSPQS